MTSQTLTIFDVLRHMLLSGISLSTIGLDVLRHMLLSQPSS